MKAFVINVVGDIGLVLAAFLIFRELGAFDYLTVFEEAHGHFEPDGGTIVAICLLLLVGALRQVRAAAAPHLAARTRWRARPRSPR